MLVNKYVNWEQMFADLVNEHMSEMKYAIENNDSDEPIEAYRNIIQFYNQVFIGNSPSIPIDLDECSIDNDYIYFAFSEEYQTANESDTQNDSTFVLIQYDRDGEMFNYYKID